MTKEAEVKLCKAAEKVFELRAQKKAIEEELKGYEDELKQGLNENSLVSGRFGYYNVKLTKVAASKVVDTVALKAAGLFEKYSKDKAGYDKLTVEKA